MEALYEAQKVELKRKEESMQKKWIEAQEECSFLKVGNLELQATNGKLIEESKTFQTNDELRMQNLELHCQCTVLDSKLGESQIVFSGIFKSKNLVFRSMKLHLFAGDTYSLSPFTQTDFSTLFAADYAFIILLKFLVTNASELISNNY
ncbi:hypothetical protein JHK87_056960 [Glycine soja]|nr:hypothetical protein JHK87_056960 [Glycine soja]